MADAERPALLIVDDDPLIAEALSYFLERDFLVITADSRDAAVAAVRQLPLPPPLALVDLG
ncbi:MAG: sigma-54-dependent Fis family transcriptional regulator, partial [Rhodocyclaceae bacterium]|nr:sigma-54-dependent Fis family transcriptional regulator [Rhodocyclaceae bacterium]